GWAVTDCRVALTATGYIGRVSTANDFREVTGLLLERMLAEAGTWVFEPVHRFDLEFPKGSSSVVLQLLRDAAAAITGQFSTDTTGYLSGTMATEEVVGFETRLPSSTRGQAVFAAGDDRHRPARGTRPRRNWGEAAPPPRRTPRARAEGSATRAARDLPRPPALVPRWSDERNGRSGVSGIDSAD